MIEFQEVRKEYGTVVALDGVSFTVPDGTVTVLIGPSGCGKSTSLKLINRLLEPTDGYVRVDGRPVKTFSPHDLRRGIGYVIQSVGLFPHMTVEANIGIVPRLLGWSRADRKTRARELLELIGLDPEQYAGKFPAQLSGGEAQRVGVARALAANPPILLMDEPFGAVDPLNREVLQQEFLRVQQKLRKTVVFVTHDLDEAITVADHVVIMDRGRVVQQGTPEEILARPRDDFVRSFVGTDRSLRRLVRFTTGEYVEPAYRCRLDADLAEATPVLESAARAGAIVYAVDAEGRLRGTVGETRRALSAGTEPDSGAHSSSPAADSDSPSSGSACAERQGGEPESPARGQARTVAEIYESWDQLGAPESLSAGSSLREALSQLLTASHGEVPVVDGEGRLLGRVTLKSVRAAGEAAADQREAGERPPSVAAGERG